MAIKPTQAPPEGGAGGSPPHAGGIRQWIFGRIMGGKKRDPAPFVGFKGSSGGGTPKTTGVVGNSGGPGKWIGFIGE